MKENGAPSRFQNVVASPAESRPSESRLSSSSQIAAAQRLRAGLDIRGSCCRPPSGVDLEFHSGHARDCETFRSDRLVVSFWLLNNGEARQRFAGGSVVGSAKGAEDCLEILGVSTPPPGCESGPGALSASVSNSRSIARDLRHGKLGHFTPGDGRFDESLALVRRRESVRRRLTSCCCRIGERRCPRG